MSLEIRWYLYHELANVWLFTVIVRHEYIMLFLSLGVNLLKILQAMVITMKKWCV